ncbi:MAG: isopentenyl-diphosphate Delta-isomerase [Candidatus Pacebacteria bacterium]|nr:isopentenyl-diphosphate Delta-isomerase [Candidatus Paceibacterota bacterium]
MAKDIILIDESNNQIGTAEKMEAHRQGLLHRAFSILIYNQKGEILLQRRAASKYHCPGLWTNTCCSHPRPGENLLASAERRLKEEMGFSAPLRKTGLEFVYKIKVGELIEHEYDYVLEGSFDGEPILNPEEVDAYKWIDMKSLDKDIEENPQNYTPWFRLIIGQGDPLAGDKIKGLERYQVKNKAN